jgi:hypothetical protein
LSLVLGLGALGLMGVTPANAKADSPAELHTVGWRGGPEWRGGTHYRWRGGSHYYWRGGTHYYWRGGSHYYWRGGTRYVVPGRAYYPGPGIYVAPGRVQIYGGYIVP